MTRLKFLFAAPFCVALAACSSTGLTTLETSPSHAQSAATVDATIEVLPMTAASVIETPASEPAVLEAQPEPEVTPTPEVVQPQVIESAAVTLGRQFFDEGDLRGARTALSQALDEDLDFEAEQEVLDLLSEINLSLFTSTSEQGDLTTYTVASGDSLSKIAKSYGTTWQMIRRLNGLKSNNIRVGQELRVPNGELGIRVRKDKFAMDLLINGDFVKRYKVGLGVNDSTPEGEFVVRNRIPYPQDGTFPFGHPEHRLGSHWLGLKGAPEYKGYGIHGCPYEKYDEIGTECSQGCVRVTNEEVEELFEILPTGTRVLITD